MSFYCTKKRKTFVSFSYASEPRFEHWPNLPRKNVKKASTFEKNPRGGTLCLRNGLFPQSQNNGDPPPPRTKPQSLCMRSRLFPKRDERTRILWAEGVEEKTEALLIYGALFRGKEIFLVSVAGYEGGKNRTKPLVLPGEGENEALGRGRKRRKGNWNLRGVITTPR